MSNAAILLGGGSSIRMQGYTEDKILVMAQGKPLFAYSLEAFIKSEVVDNLVIVYKDNDQKQFIQEWILNNTSFPTIHWVQGGERRQDSVLAGLRALTNETHYVFIHDLARPLIRAESLRELYQTLLTENTAVLAHPVHDTIKQSLPESPKTLNDLNRDTLWATETPQAFQYSLARTAYEEVANRKLHITDDAAALTLIGHPVTLVPNKYPNPKITLPSDLDYLEFLLQTKTHHASL